MARTGPVTFGLTAIIDLHLAQPMPNAIQRTSGVDPRFTTTAFGIDGYRIIQTLGIVRGITVRSRSVFGTIGAGFQTIFGGNITMFTRLCENAREEAFNIMLVHAEEVGANAVIGVRYDAGELMQGVTEVLCYGTAVTLEATGS